MEEAVEEAVEAAMEQEVEVQEVVEEEVEEAEEVAVEVAEVAVVRGATFWLRARIAAPTVASACASVCSPCYG